MNRERVIERWENVLRVLKSLTPHQRRKHWDMSQFGVQTDCGTVCCAVGHCVLDPWFRRRGFAVTFADYDPNVDPRNRGWPIGVDRDEWINRLYDFFGEDGVSEIFQNEERRSVGTVIREVRAHIKALRTEL